MTPPKQRASPGVPPGLWIPGASGRTVRRKYRPEAYFGGRWHRLPVVEIAVPVELPRTQSLPAVLLSSVGG